MIILMGVSGTGKTSLGKKLSQDTNWPFFDADDFHPQSNKEKMKSGLQLTDSDRKPWLEILSKKINEWSLNGQAILACSALKEEYRALLLANNKSIQWVVLNGSFNLIKDRIESRENHFFNPSLLQSQFNDLEVPNYGIHLDVNESVDELSLVLQNKLASKNDAAIGIIGMGVMGQGIALNCAENGFKTAVYNRSSPGEEHIIEEFKSKNNSFTNVSGFTDLSEFVGTLKLPRNIWLMISSGPAIDSVIDQLVPLLDEGDVIIDGGNSHYPDTQRRAQQLEKKNINFVGCGVSGGEVGARFGASIMFGGSKKAYGNLSPILNKIAAKDFSGKPCQGFMGKEGAGHFVKMVHNGIEYAEMQLLAETFDVLSKQMSYPEMSALFKEMNQGSEASYLLEITAEILLKKEGNQFLVDLILDQASSKGTGMWSSSAALALGSVNNMMSSAVFARYISALKETRYSLAKQKSKHIKKEKISVSELKDAYTFARIINHIQGFNLIETASEEYGWDYNPSEIARIWTRGCIIRSQLMERLSEEFKSDKTILKINLLLDLLKETEAGAASIIHHGIDQKIPLDGYGTAYNYWIAICSEKLPANLIQAQRDFFGAHTYRRIDKPIEESFHTEWKKND
jgi:6-phosphogluconate dehydrogenase